MNTLATTHPTTLTLDPDQLAGLEIILQGYGDRLEDKARALRAVGLDAAAPTDERYLIGRAIRAERAERAAKSTRELLAIVQGAAVAG